MSKFVRKFHTGMGDAVARRTYLRTKMDYSDLSKIEVPLVLNKNEKHWREWYVAATNSDVEVVFDDTAETIAGKMAPETRWETWGEVADRVAEGSFSLLPSQFENLKYGQESLSDMIAKGTVLMSGRHLSHGDHHQKEREQTAFTNCSTAATSFALFYLLLNGSGVGRDYSDQIMLIDWEKHLPNIVPVLSSMHPDFDYNIHIDPRDAKHMYGEDNESVVWFKVPDSREGWAQAMEMIETITYFNQLNNDKVTVVILDFTDVRGEGEPIMGMQGKPSSGPAPIIKSMASMNMVRGSGMKPWKATMYIDHMLASVVLVGGLRRAARISTKYWKDPDILEYAQVKRPIEFVGMEHEKINETFPDFKPMSFLWSSNNSIATDVEFYDGVGNKGSDADILYETVSKCAYYDGNGEPGFVNVDRLTFPEDDDLDMDFMKNGEYFQSDIYQPSSASKQLMSVIYKSFRDMPYHYGVNPCGEEVLNLLGAFCVIADIAPLFADTLAETMAVVDNATMALIRVNTMPSVYANEVKRTNRIGVGLTGIFEFAWKFFKVGFEALVNPDIDGYLELIDEATLENVDKYREHDDIRVRAACFWEWAGLASRQAYKTSREYSELLGVNAPHTVTTTKPSGCRPLNAITTTDIGIMTLEELLNNHEWGNQWTDFDGNVNVIQNDGTKGITKTFDNGDAEVFRITMTYGLAVESTSDHPWYVVNRNGGEWIKTSELKPTDQIEVRTGIYGVTTNVMIPEVEMDEVLSGGNDVEFYPDHINDDIAWLMGVLHNSINEYATIDFESTSEEVKERIVDIFKDQFGFIGECFDENLNIHIKSYELWNWLKELEVGGKTSPMLVRMSSVNAIISYMAGLMDMNNDQWINITDETFARHVQSVGWAVGLAYDRHYENGSYNLRLSYRTLPDALSKIWIKMTSTKQVRLLKNDQPSGEIVSIESIGVHPTYDIEVADNHWFYDGSVKSHNTVSKLFGLTEGWHLPPIRYYIRWVQFRDNNPMLDEYRDNGYPVRKLTTYRDHHIVGFPTAHSITEMEGIEDYIVTGDEASLADQYKWLMLGEYFWIEGGTVESYKKFDGDIDKMTDDRGYKYGAQISITLKFTPDEMDYETYRRTVLENQKSVRCASVMPKTDNSSYEYLPEESITKEEYERLKYRIENPLIEDIAREHVDCETGACPIDFSDSEEKLTA